MDKKLWEKRISKKGNEKCKRCLSEVDKLYFPPDNKEGIKYKICSDCIEELQFKIHKEV